MIESCVSRTVTATSVSLLIAWKFSVPGVNVTDLATRRTRTIRVALCGPEIAVNVAVPLPRATIEIT